MAKVPYVSSVRKQLQWVAAFFGVLIFAGIALYPVNSLPKIVLFSVIAVLAGLLAIYRSQKHAKEAKCPSCGADLYELIQTAKLGGSHFHHCPACGNAVEV